MAKTWVLDTETKGTGAHIAPLRDGESAPEPPLNLTRFRAPAPPRPADPPEREPRLFRVVDVLAARTVAEEVPVREALQALGSMRTPLDARVYMREPGSRRARLLSLAETRALWELAAGGDPAGSRAPASHPAPAGPGRS
jgi:hypothetical protein